MRDVRSNSRGKTVRFQKSFENDFESDSNLAELPFASELEIVDDLDLVKEVEEVNTLSTCFKPMPLTYDYVDYKGKILKVCVDSATQVTVVMKTSLVDVLDIPAVIGKGILLGISDDPRPVDMVEMDLRIHRTVRADQFDLSPTLNVECALIDNKRPRDYDMLMHPLTLQELSSLPMNIVQMGEEIKSCDKEQVECEETCPPVKPILEVLAEEITGGPEIIVEETTEVGTDQLRSEQLSDTSLKEAWDLAKRGKGNYLVKGGLLFHKDKVCDYEVEQLVVPETRRRAIEELAHESSFGAHLAGLKTRQRIALSFYWPTLRKDVGEFCRTCAQCQSKARVMASDRVPIEPIERPDVPFTSIVIDCIGPLVPASSKGHQYALCIVDMCTRWPSVVLLKSMTAKAVCDALLEQWMQTGIPSEIHSDMGTNFCSKLNTEFLSRMGCSPRFNCPGRPQSSGVCERFNQTLKRMIHHAMQEYGRQWYTVVPYLVWALREVPNATTNVSPYMMLYGRPARGPLAVLKDSWIGELEKPPNLGKSPEQYLTELKRKLIESEKFACINTETEQARYIRNYNKNTRSKQFQMGDKVVILIPDSTHKTFAKWQNGTVVRVVTPHTYMVDLENGARHRIHADKMRLFLSRCSSVVVLSDQDEDFGVIHSVPTKYQSTCTSK